MSLTIVPVYAAVFALLLVTLSIRVIRVRRRERVPLGAGGNRLVERAMRTQGNFTEYVPLTLLLLAMLELKDAAAWHLHLLCAVLLVGRLIHAYGVGREPETYTFRTVGMALTFFALITTALSLLIAVASA